LEAREQEMTSAYGALETKKIYAYAENLPLALLDPI
jgi:hypothetical protein